LFRIVTLGRLCSQASVARLRQLQIVALPVLLSLVSFFAVSAFDLTGAKQPPLAHQQMKDEGQQLFASICAGCHGLDGKGAERAPDIARRPQVVQLSDHELMEILRQGKPTAGMPPFEYLGPPKLSALLTYLRTLQGKGAAGALPGDPQSGRQLFFGQARCSQCHAVHGEGGFLGRDLSTYGATLSPSEIRTNILQVGGPFNKLNKTAVVLMRDGQKFSGIIRNEDNFSIQLQSTDGTFHFLKRSDVAHLDFRPDPVMPTDYDKSLSASQLNDLSSYLASIAQVHRKREFSDEDDDN